MTHKPKNIMAAEYIIIIMLIGLAAGVLSGLVGIGGGVILVPAMVYFLSYSQHQAQGTSLGVLCLPVVILGFLKYYQDAKASGTPIDVRVVLLLAAGFIVGGYFGGSLAIKIDKESLRKIFGIVLLYMGAKMIGLEKLIIQWVKGLFA